MSSVMLFAIPKASKYVYKKKFTIVKTCLLSSESEQVAYEWHSIPTEGIN